MIDLLLNVILFKISDKLHKKAGMQERGNREDVFIPFEDQCRHDSNGQQQSNGPEHFPEDFDDWGEF